MQHIELLTILIAIFAGLSLAPLGTILHVRRQLLLGDAITHAVLPGIVLGYLFSGSRNSFYIYLGAVFSALVLTWFSQLLHRKAEMHEDSSLGVCFTLLFALGILLISAYSQHIDLDQECVLYGEIALAPFDALTIGGQEYGPRALWILCGLTLVNFFVIIFFLPRLVLTSFDALYARALGIQTAAWDYALMALIAISTVACLEVLGALLVVALLAIPSACARLLSKRIPIMILLTATAATISSICGYQLATFLNGSISASIAVVAGGLLIMIVVGQRFVGSLLNNFFDS